MSARLTILPPYFAGGHQPHALLTIWVKGKIYEQIPLAMPRKRNQWLPLWIPGNILWDDSISAQKQIIDRVKVHCERLFGEVIAEFETREERTDA